MDLTKLTTLIAVAESGSFSASARRLQTQVSTVSRRVADLEEEVGASLVVRGGRGVRLTPEGERFTERARHILREVECALADVRGEAHVVTHLRVSVPLEAALSLLLEPIAAITRDYPSVNLHVHTSARRVSLFEEDFDAAIRIGPLKDSDLIARQLGEVSVVGVAHAGGAIGSPEEIARHRFVSVGPARKTQTVSFGGEQVSIPDNGPTVSSFTEAAELASRAGLATFLPSYTALRYLRDGRLEMLHPELLAATPLVSMLVPRRHRHTAALADLADHVRDELAAVEEELKGWLAY